MSEATTYWDTNVTAALLGGVIGFAASTITVIWTTYYVRMVHNGLRHSFCSYRLAVTKSAAQVALEAGQFPENAFRELPRVGDRKGRSGLFWNFTKRQASKRKEASAESRCGWQSGPRQERKEAPPFGRGDGGLACSWEEDLAEHIGGVIGEERRARWLPP